MYCDCQQLDFKGLWLNYKIIWHLSQPFKSKEAHPWEMRLFELVRTLGLSERIKLNLAVGALKSSLT